MPTTAPLSTALLALSGVVGPGDWRGLLASARGVRSFRIELPAVLGAPSLALEGVLAGAGGRAPAGTVLSQRLVVGPPDPARNDECGTAIAVESGLVAGNNLRATT